MYDRASGPAGRKATRSSGRWSSAVFNRAMIPAEQHLLAEERSCMNAYERDCGCVYCHSWRMYSHAATASFERYAVTKRPVNDGTRKPWRNRCISPVSPAAPNRFCPVPLRIAFAHWNSCP